MVTGRIPYRPLGEIDEAKSERHTDGSALLVYSCGALGLLEKRAPYSSNSPRASVDVENECPDAESAGPSQA